MFISSVAISRSCVACADPEIFVRGVHSDFFFFRFFFVLFFCFVFLVDEGRMDPNTTKWPTIECRLVVVDSLLMLLPLWDSVVVLCFVVRQVLFILVRQSS